MDEVLAYSKTVEIVSRNTGQANMMVNQPNKTADLVAFAHAALFSPALTTLMKAVKNNFLHDFPGLTEKALRDHPPITAATAMGHLDQVRKNQRSTKKAKSKPATALLPIPATDPTQEIDIDIFPEQLTEPILHHCYAAITSPADSTGQIYTDQTGKFMVPGSSGALYVFILYDYDSNSIHAEPMHNKTGVEIVRAYIKVYNRLVGAGRKPLLHRLDNECSNELREYLAENQVQIQLVPPGIHRANAAERAIRTFKNHFLAGLATCDPEFHLHLWDRLIPQCELTLNLLRSSRINPKLSAHAQVHGQYSYNSTPLAPPGCHVMVHVKPGARESWAPHALDAWYLGPAPEHYRCYRVWLWSTKHERTSDTLTWLPKTVKLPQLNPTETIIQCTVELTSAINKLNADNPPSESLVQNADHVKALKNFHDILLTIPSIAETKPEEIPESLPRVEIFEQPTQRLQEIPPAELRVVPQPPQNIIHAPELRRSQRTIKPTYKTSEYASSAINVDTGLLTEYKQLLKSSQGHLWDYSSCEEWA